MFRLLKKVTSIGAATLRYEPKKTLSLDSFRGAPEIDPDLCTGCGQCVIACPTNALAIEDRPTEDSRKLYLSYGSCIFCGLCEPACPYTAISFRGKFELASRSKEGLTRAFPFSLAPCQKDKAYLSSKELPEKPKATVIARSLPAGRQAKATKQFRVGGNPKGSDLNEIGENLQSRIKSLFGRSLHIRQVDAGSSNDCELEISNLSNPFYDVERLGIHFVASPRHADMLLVTGPVTRQMELALLKTYEATPAPKLVVACGTDAIDGGMFQGSYAVIGGVDRVIPVDVYIPGSPPRPEAILYGIFLALDRVQ